MKLRVFLYGYAITLAIHLLSLLQSWNALQQLSKLLLMPLLLVFSGFQPHYYRDLKKPLLAALAFSWVGDILLQADHRGNAYFISGLIAFLLAHLCYIWLFRIIKARELGRRWFPLVFVLTFLYAATLIAYLLPLPGNLSLPVILYTLALCFMFILAAHAMPLQHYISKLLICGAGLFVLSDSMLAINKFDTPFPMASVYIMLTYGLAQSCLVYGLMQYTVSRNIH